MDVVQSVDDEVITSKGKISNDMAEPDAEAEPKVDVASMAGDLAMQDVKADSFIYPKINTSMKILLENPTQSYKKKEDLSLLSI